MSLLCLGKKISVLFPWEIPKLGNLKKKKKKKLGNLKKKKKKLE